MRNERNLEVKGKQISAITYTSITCIFLVSIVRSDRAKRSSLPKADEGKNIIFSEIITMLLCEYDRNMNCARVNVYLQKQALISRTISICFTCTPTSTEINFQTITLYYFRFFWKIRAVNFNACEHTLQKRVAPH